MQDLNISLIQTPLFWEDADANLAMFDGLLEQVPLGTHLILLPEMFTTGFSINPALAEKPEGKSFEWLRRKADEHNCVIAGSILADVNGKYFNRLFWVRPDGTFDTYDKRHLFRLGEEYKVFTAGHRRPVFELLGWKILPLICYDLRFPVWSKNRYINQNYEYDLLICVANWPAVRQYAWKQLLIARAIENQAYAAAVNRVGADGNGLEHTGDSTVTDPLGQIICQAMPNSETILSATLSWNALQQFREQFTIGLDWDEFEVKH